MQLFHKIIKAEESVSDSVKALVQTEFQVDSVSVAPPATIEKDVYYKEKQAAARYMEDAQASSMALLQKAQSEADEIRFLAQEEGFQEGEKKGQKEGFQAGYQRGIEKARQESREIKESVQQMLKDASREVLAFYEDKRLEIINLAAQMAEKIVHEKIDSSDDKILTLLYPVLNQMEQESKFVTLTVKPELEEFMKEKVKELEIKFPLYRFAILLDAHLEEHGCIVESSHVIIDLQVKQQLETMVRELEEVPVIEYV